MKYEKRFFIERAEIIDLPKEVNEYTGPVIGKLKQKLSRFLTEVMGNGQMFSDECVKNIEGGGKFLVYYLARAIDRIRGSLDFDNGEIAKIAAGGKIIFTWREESVRINPKYNMGHQFVYFHEYQVGDVIWYEESIQKLLNPLREAGCPEELLKLFEDRQGAGNGFRFYELKPLMDEWLKAQMPPFSEVLLSPKQVAVFPVYNGLTELPKMPPRKVCDHFFVQVKKNLRICYEWSEENGRYEEIWRDEVERGTSWGREWKKDMEELNPPLLSRILY